MNIKYYVSTSYKPPSLFRFTFNVIQDLATGLHGCMSQMNLSEDVYALGETSKLVATELANMGVARSRRKVHCFLIIVNSDRSNCCLLYWFF